MIREGNISDTQQLEKEKNALAHQQKQLQKIISDTNDFVHNHLPEKKRDAVMREVERIESNLLRRISSETDITLSEIQKAHLTLKLLRHFQNHEDLDENVLFDAVAETPKFLNKSKGSIHRLFEIHQQKTLMAIAERRKKRAEISGEEGLNPYEALFETSSGKYYMARLLNMPHLEEETDFMHHCVGSSTSYLNRIKRGDIEILSFRKTPEINKERNALNVDEPVLTIQYDVKTGRIAQIKKEHDAYISYDDPYFNDLIEALEKLQDTRMDNGAKRKITSINISELENIPVNEDQVATGRGTIPTSAFTEDDFVLRIGKLTTKTSKAQAAAMINKYEGAHYTAEEVARTTDEITAETRVYIGDLNRGDEDILNNRREPLHIIGKTDFRNSRNLQRIPDNISFGGDVYFIGCTALETISDSVSFGGYAVFTNCTALETISNNVSFGGSAYFIGCTALKTIPDNVSFGGNVYFRNCTALTTIPNSVSFDGYANFRGCTALKTISNNVSFDGYANFRGCSSLSREIIAMLRQKKANGDIPGTLILPDGIEVW